MVGNCIGLQQEMSPSNFLHSGRQVPCLAAFLQAFEHLGGFVVVLVGFVVVLGGFVVVVVLGGFVVVLGDFVVVVFCVGGGVLATSLQHFMSPLNGLEKGFSTELIDCLELMSDF